MTATHQTLLAKLQPMFSNRAEDIAVEALGHILSGSDAARQVLLDMLAAGGAHVGEIAQIRTQVSGDEGTRPDLAGFDQDGRERVLIEAKFWAGLTENQPVAYLERLPANKPSVLLFVAPAARIDLLWAELGRRVSESKSGISLDPDIAAAGMRGATAAGKRHLMLTSWANLLDRMAGPAAAAADSHAATDIQQLRGLTDRQDHDAFLPLRSEELGLEFPRRMLGLQRLVDDATDRAIAAEWASTKGLKVTPQAWGYGRYLRLSGASAWFGISFYDWARTQPTPLWLWFSNPPEETLHALASLRRRNPPELFDYDGLCVPIALPVAAEYDAVLDAVVKRLEEIARLLGTTG